MFCVWVFFHESLQEGEGRKRGEDLGSGPMEDKERWARSVLDKIGSVSNGTVGTFCVPGWDLALQCWSGAWGE